MRRASGLLLVVAALWPAGTASAPKAAPRFTVDSKGSLRISARTWKALNLKPGPDGTICVEFPNPATVPPPLRRPVPGERRETLRIHAPIARDGTLVVPPTPVQGGRLPGAPGTRYVGRKVGGCLTLRRE